MGKRKDGKPTRRKEDIDFITKISKIHFPDKSEKERKQLVKKKSSKSLRQISKYLVDGLATKTKETYTERKKPRRERR